MRPFNIREWTVFAAFMMLIAGTCQAQVSPQRFSEVRILKPSPICMVSTVRSTPHPEAPVVSVLFDLAFVDLIESQPKQLVQHSKCQLALVLKTPLTEDSDLYVELRIAQLKSAPSSLKISIRVGNQRQRLDYDEGWIIEGNGPDADRYVRLLLPKVKKGTREIPITITADGKRGSASEILHWSLDSIDACLEKAGETHYCYGELDR